MTAAAQYYPPPPPPYPPPPYPRQQRRPPDYARYPSDAAYLSLYGMFSGGHYSGLGVGNGTGPTQSGGMTGAGRNVRRLRPLSHPESRACRHRCPLDPRKQRELNAVWEQDSWRPGWLAHRRLGRSTADGSVLPVRGRRSRHQQRHEYDAHGLVRLLGTVWRGRPTGEPAGRGAL